MNYHYYQREGGNEKWSPIPDNKLDTITDAMFVTVLSVDTPVSDDADKETLAAIKYKGPLYFDLDDADSPASTAVNAVQLVKKLEELGVFPAMLEIYATGGKGFHMLVPEECFLTKPPKAGLPLLPAVYKEMAFNLAVDSLDLVVYTARKGRMFRQVNVLRPNGMHKVRIAYTELVQIAEMSAADKQGAEAFYKELCSAPRRTLDIEQDAPELAMGMLALFDQCKSKVSKAATARKKYKPIRLPDNLPSFDALLRGEGVKSDAGFHKIAMQVAITAHARGIGRQELIDAAEGLCDLHDSDGNRYNSAAKRREEIGRMWDYTEDNACYTFSSGAIKSLLTHNAPDLQGLDVSDKEVLDGIQDPDNAMVDDPYDHAGVTITDRGAYTMSENGPKRILALGFENVTELVSAETNQLTVIEVDINLGGKALGHKVIEVDTFNSVNNFNKLTMPYGQSFNGTDAQARGMMMRLVEKARRSKRRMYVVSREGLDIVSMPFHEDEEARKEFLVWADIKSVTPEPSMQEKDIKLRFVGFPDVTGQYKTDLSLAPALIGWKKEDGNAEGLETMLENLLTCQKPAYIGKLLGWMIACHYRMLFNKVYNQFPLLHINGAAGMGKTAMTRLFANLHYYNQDPKMLTPTSTLFAVSYAASGSASIPLILDEFKPSEMNQGTYDRFKLMLRDAYNCRNTERGGGNRDNSDYRALHTTALSAPICFIAEAAESETALMERIVLLTLSKPPVIQAQEFHRKFSYAQANKNLLGILGGYMAAQIVQRYSTDMLREEFDVVYGQARKDLMLQAGEAESLSAADLRRKSGAKERTVYNYSVAKFGLIKFKKLLQGLFPGKFDEVLDQMIAEAYSTVEEIQVQTIPEWLKVLNNLADMAKVDSMAPYFCKQGSDFAIIEFNGKTCLELYSRAFYIKYRVYSATSRTKPLFPNEAAFIHGLGSLPALESTSMNQELSVPGGSHIFDLDQLRGAGFISPE